MKEPGERNSFTCGSCLCMLVLCHSEFDPAGPSVAVSLLGEEKERNHELSHSCKNKGLSREQIKAAPFIHFHLQYGAKMYIGSETPIRKV
jgi:hypothetical protein